MAYKNNIPQPTDALRASQNDLLNNFAVIKAAFDINHVTFDDANQGKHNLVMFLEQAAAPTVAANNIALYSQLSTLTGISELFVKNENGDEYEFTSTLSAATGWTRFPSGILLKWGSDTGTGSHITTFPVGATIPPFTNVFTVFLTPISSAATDVDWAVRLRSAATTTFTSYCSQRSTVADTAVTFQYLAIGI